MKDEDIYAFSAVPPAASAMPAAKAPRRIWPWVLGALLLVFALAVAGSLAALNALLDAGRDLRPVGGRDDARHDIEWEGAFDTAHIEGDGRLDLRQRGGGAQGGGLREFDHRAVTVAGEAPHAPADPGPRRQSERARDRGRGHSRPPQCHRRHHRRQREPHGHRGNRGRPAKLQRCTQAAGAYAFARAAAGPPWPGA